MSQRLRPFFFNYQSLILKNILFSFTLPFILCQCTLIQKFRFDKESWLLRQCQWLLPIVMFLWVSNAELVLMIMIHIMSSVSFFLQLYMWNEFELKNSICNWPPISQEICSCKRLKGNLYRVSVTLCFHKINNRMF